MKNHRFAVTGLVVFAAASLALAGCSASSKTTDNPSTSPSPSAAAVLDPKAALTAALAVVASKGFDFTETIGAPGIDNINATGTIDPATKSASISGKGTESGLNLSLDVVEQGGNVWLKIDAGAFNAQAGLPKTWMTVDASKITDSTSLPFDINSPDLLDLAGLFTSVADVKLTDPTTLTGTVDLTKATGSTAPDVTDHATEAATTPFTVTFDGSGNPKSLTVDTSAYDKGSQIVFTFSNFGSPTAITPPTGASPAPATAYAFLGGS